MEIINRIKSKLFHYTWDLAYGTYHDDISEKGLVGTDIKIVHNPYKNKWFADPFIYSEDDSYLQLFVEEFDKEVRRGRIARVCIDKASNSIVDCRIILDKPTHLSFPAIYRIEGEVFVHPENSASGESAIYRYDETLDHLVEPVVLVNEPLTDAIIHRCKDEFIMYATKIPDSNGKKLLIYKSKTIFGPYEYWDSIVMDKPYARMAGAIITSSGKNIRPAQDCEGGDYGKSVLFYDNNTIIGQLRPWGKYDGLHTFNLKDKTFIIDLKKYDFPVLYRLKTKIKKTYENKK